AAHDGDQHRGVPMLGDADVRPPLHSPLRHGLSKRHAADDSTSCRGPLLRSSRSPPRGYHRWPIACSLPPWKLFPEGGGEMRSPVVALLCVLALGFVACFPVPIPVPAPRHQLGEHHALP